MNKETYLKIQYLKEIIIKLYGIIKVEVVFQLDENKLVAMLDTEKEAFRFIIKEKEISWKIQDISFSLLDSEETIRGN